MGVGVGWCGGEGGMQRGGPGLAGTSQLSQLQGVCGVVWCGVVWCGVVWCGVVWCGVVWCGVAYCLPWV